MLNERQLKIVDLLEQQPRTPGELAQQTGVSGRTILRDIDYLNFTLNGKARIFASGSAGYQLEIFERRSFFQLLQKHDNDDRLLALLLLNTFTPRAQLASALEDFQLIRGFLTTLTAEKVNAFSQFRQVD